MAVRAQHERSRYHRRVRDGGHRCFLPARPQVRGARKNIRQSWRRGGMHVQRPTAFPHGRQPGQMVSVISRQPWRPWKVSSRASGSTDRSHRPTQRGRRKNRQSRHHSRGARFLYLSPLGAPMQGLDAFPRIPAAKYHASLLQLSHYGRAGHHFHCHHGAVRFAAVAREAVSTRAGCSGYCC